MRKLASVQQILHVEEIPGADAIEKYTVLGWELVSRKGDFKPGDKAVYVEVDSVLPAGIPAFAEIAEKHKYVKTIKLRGQISQGILFRLEDLGVHKDTPIGTDLTEGFGIVKYEPVMPAHLTGLARGTFPHFIQRTDEERVQTYNKLPFGDKAYVTEKLDGTSFTCFTKDGDFQVCSRNLNLKDTEGQAHWIAAKNLKLPEKITNDRYALQGELIGPSIQQNKYAVKAPTLKFFSVYDTQTSSYVPPEETYRMLNDLDLPTVPVLEREWVIPATIPEIVEYSMGPSSLNPALANREGVVIRTLDGKHSFKAINPKFLLKYQND